MEVACSWLGLIMVVMKVSNSSELESSGYVMDERVGLW